MFNVLTTSSNLLRHHDMSFSPKHLPDIVGELSALILDITRNEFDLSVYCTRNQMLAC